MSRFFLHKMSARVHNVCSFVCSFGCRVQSVCSFVCSIWQIPAILRHFVNVYR